MKTISVPVHSELLNDLLEEALREEILIETVGGQRFVLVSVEGWQGFETNEESGITDPSIRVRNPAGFKGIFLSASETAHSHRLNGFQQTFRLITEEPHHEFA